MLCGTGLLRGRARKKKQSLPLASPSPPSFTEFTLSHSELAKEPVFPNLKKVIENEHYVPMSPMKKLCLSGQHSSLSIAQASFYDDESFSSGVYEDIVDDSYHDTDKENASSRRCIVTAAETTLISRKVGNHGNVVDSLILPETPVKGNLRTRIHNGSISTTTVFKKPLTPKSSVISNRTSVTKSTGSRQKGSESDEKKTCTLLSSGSSVMRRFLELENTPCQQSPSQSVNVDPSPEQSSINSSPWSEMSRRTSRSSMKKDGGASPVLRESKLSLRSKVESKLSLRSKKESKLSLRSQGKEADVSRKTSPSSVNEVDCGGSDGMSEPTVTPSPSGKSIASPTVTNVRSAGQLKLAISVEGNELSIHIVECCNLRSRWADLCDAYIQLQVCPDDACATRRHSHTVNNTNAPFYDKTFTFDISGMEQGRKRLVISAWHKDAQKNCGEFLGCMSFGMKHLVRKVKRNKLEGWYHLLSENVGHRKHLAVEGPQLNTPSSQPPSAVKSELDSTMIGRETFTLVIHRQASGYGFTVRGSCPAKVGRVKEGGTAHSAGLRRGDYILKINGKSVQRSSAESIASIVRHAEHMVVLDLHRPNKTRIDSSCASSRASSIPSIDLNNAIMEGQDENCPPAKLLDSKVFGGSRRSVVGSSCKNIVQEQAREHEKEQGSTKKKLFGVEVESLAASAATESDCKWDPEISAIERIDSSGRMSALKSSSNKLRNYISVPDFSDGEEDEEEVGMSATGTTWQEGELETSWMEESVLDCSTELPWQPDCSHQESALSSVSHMETARRDAAFSGGDSSGELNTSDLSQSIHDLISLERRFSEEIQRAIQCYSRPLRHCLASSRKHQHLFQNLEKVAAIAGFMAKQVEDRHQSVGAVYASRVEMVCEAYELYLAGFARAQRLLAELSSDQQFCDFLRLTAQSCDITLSDTINRPAQHVQALHRQLQTIQQETTANSSEYMHLSAIISELETTLSPQSRSAQPNNTTSPSLTHSMLSGLLLDGTTSVSAEMSSVSAAGVSSVSAGGEMLELQSRLVIPRHVKKFKLANGSRHLIFSGEVSSQDGRPLCLLLLSDLLLVTMATDDGQLMVLEEPMVLESMAVDFDRKNDLEFSVSAPSHHGITSTQVVFSTSSQEQKVAWKSILEHRIFACNQQTRYSDLLSGSQLIDVL